MTFVRKQLLFISILGLSAGAFLAQAEEIPGSPGWSMTKIERTGDDNSYGDGKVFYGLKPPDQRAAITIDNRTASRLRAGELGADTVYGGAGSGGKAVAAKEEEYTYGKHNGIVVAEPPNMAVVPVAAESRPSRSSSSSGSSLPPIPSSASSGDKSATARAIAAAKEAQDTKADRSGASSMPGAQAAGSQPKEILNPLRKLQAEQDAQLALAKEMAKPTKSDSKELPPSPIALTQVAQGLGMSSDGKNKDKEQPISVWPEGDPDKKPGEEGGPPKCPASMYKEFFMPDVIRLAVPAGCNSMRIKAWGAGGGDGDVLDDGTGRGAKGGGGAFVSVAAKIDPKRYEFVIVIGMPGGNGRKGVGGAGGYPGGGKGGSGGAGAGGGGGGFSGVFYVEKAKVHQNEKPIELDKAIVIAAGGGGGGGTALASASDGGPGGAEKGGGFSGGTSKEPGIAWGNGGNGNGPQGGDGGNGSSNEGAAAGGGGGSGFFGGAGGNGNGSSEVTTVGGSGGSSYSRFLESFDVKPGNANQAGNPTFAPRGKSGDNGYPGRVILEFF